LTRIRIDDGAVRFSVPVVITCGEYVLLSQPGPLPAPWHTENCRIYTTAGPHVPPPRCAVHHCRIGLSIAVVIAQSKNICSQCWPFPIPRHTYGGRVCSGGKTDVPAVAIHHDPISPLVSVEIVRGGFDDSRPVNTKKLSRAVLAIGLSHRSMHICRRHL
jgi:hypothetical protein